MKTPNQLREEFVNNEELCGKMGYCNEVFANKIADYWLDIIHQRDEELVSEIEQLHINTDAPTPSVFIFRKQGIREAKDAILAHIRSKRE